VCPIWLLIIMYIDYFFLISFNASLPTSFFVEQIVKASLYSSFHTVVYELDSLRASTILYSCINNVFLVLVIYRENFLQTVRYIVSVQADEKFSFFEIFCYNTDRVFFTNSLYFFIMFLQNHCTLTYS